MKGCAEKTEEKSNKLRERFDTYCKRFIYFVVYNRVRREMRYLRFCRAKYIPGHFEIGEYDEYPSNMSFQQEIRGEPVVIRDENLARALKRLTSRRREILLMSMILGMSLDEIARELNLRYETVKCDKYKALRKIRKEMGGKSEKGKS